MSGKDKLYYMPKGCTIPSFEMRGISCLLRLSLLPKLGQRPPIFMSETTWLQELKSLAIGWLASFAQTT